MTTSTFKAGDKVKHLSHGDGEITYGPLAGSTGSYILKTASGVERTVSSDYLKAKAAFKVGDKATGASTGAVYEILAGPFKSSSEVWYAARHTDGREMKLGETTLKPLAPVDDGAIKAGDRIRVTRHHADGAPVSVGDEFTVRTLTTRGLMTVEGGGAGWYLGLGNVEKVAPTTFTYLGITYDVPGTYRDTDGDRWTLGFVGGEARAYLGMTAPRDRDGSDSLTYVIDTYGPLRKV